MSCNSISEEMKNKYENEYCEFLIQKISHAGGSLHFQHLTGLLIQLRFNVKDTFGTTKSELMKFLRAHPEFFQIDSKGIVTIVGSPVLEDCDSTDVIDEDNTTEKKKKALLAKIENGVGFIEKIFVDFGIIKAVKPLETRVYFTPPEYSTDKDSLFIDLDLEVKSEVYFNAVYGHNDYEIEYRATKVWQMLDAVSNESSDYKTEKFLISKMNGEGIISEILSNSGCISVSGKTETVHFYKNSVKDCDKDLTHFFKIGDHVEFAARRAKNNPKKWHAMEVIKKPKKSYNQSYNQSSQSAKNMKGVTTTNKKIENQIGKIYPYTHGAVIKFGKDYSELADGDSTEYFLYGSKVSDIAWEFSEGDDIYFDAVKINIPPGWKAVLVWIGEKPVGANSTEKSIEENYELSDDQSSVLSSGISSECSNSSVKSRSVKSKSSFNIEPLRKKKNIAFDHSFSKNLIKSNAECENNNLKHSKRALQKYSLKKCKNKMLKKETERGSIFVNNYNDAKQRSTEELDETSNLDDHYKCIFSSRESVSDINPLESSQNSSEDDNEINNVIPNVKNFVKKNKCESSINMSSHKPSENNNSRESYEVTSTSLKNGFKASIKNFEDIDGKIIYLYCKHAIVRSSHLQKDVDFVLNAFYLNGKSVEEQQVIDLKEVIKVGDIVKFNCFEIIDDMGDIYRKVTMAWKGPKPKVYEMTPEEFIREYELSVSVRNEVDSNCMPEHRTTQKSFLTVLNNTDSDEALNFNSRTKSSSLNDISKDDTFDYLMEPENETDDNSEKDLLSDDLSSGKLLTEKIIQRLKSSGFTSSDLKVDLNIMVDDIVNLVLKNSGVKGCNSATLNQEVPLQSSCTKAVSEVLCSACKKRSKEFTSNKAVDVEVQTIITGEIIATRDEFSFMKLE